MDSLRIGSDSTTENMSQKVNESNVIAEHLELSLKGKLSDEKVAANLAALHSMTAGYEYSASGTAAGLVFYAHVALEAPILGVRTVFQGNAGGFVSAGGSSLRGTLKASDYRTLIDETCCFSFTLAVPAPGHIWFFDSSYILLGYFSGAVLGVFAGGGSGSGGWET